MYQSLNLFQAQWVVATLDKAKNNSAFYKIVSVGWVALCNSTGNVIFKFNREIKI